MKAKSTIFALAVWASLLGLVVYSVYQNLKLLETMSTFNIKSLEDIINNG